MLSNTAAGGSNGIVAAGPSNKYDGARDPGVSGTSDLNFGGIAPIDHDAPDYPDSTTSSYALGSVPD